MKRVALALALLTVSSCATPGSSGAQGPEEAGGTINVSGTWKGVNFTSKVPGPSAVKLVFTQDGSKVTGKYCVATGVCGNGEGTISADRMEVNWKNTTPSCPGQYSNKYIVSDDQMMWKFVGKDCLGEEDGHGYAHKDGS